MPCNSDYLEPNKLEVNLSKVYNLFDELKTGKLPKDWDSGFDNRVYNKGLTKEHLDEKVAKLCSKLQKIKDISKYSLEMQMWWRDHQKADKERLLAEIKLKKDEADKKKAITKLSPYERKLLGLKI